MITHSKTPYSIAFETDCVELHDMFRDSIVRELKTYATASNYEEKYMLTIREKGFYERIRQDAQLPFASTRLWSSSIV